MFVKDKFFLCIHLMYNSDQLLTGFHFDKDIKSSSIQTQVLDFIVKSDICIGLLPKRGNASVKSMLKAYKMEEMYAKHMSNNEPGHSKSSFEIEKEINCQDALISGINTVAYLSRLELYVSEDHWKKASMQLKHSLTSFIYLLEENINTVLLEWNNRRTNIYFNR